MTVEMNANEETLRPGDGDNRPIISVLCELHLNRLTVAIKRNIRWSAGGSFGRFRLNKVGKDRTRTKTMD